MRDQNRNIEESNRRKIADNFHEETQARRWTRLFQMVFVSWRTLALSGGKSRVLQLIRNERSVIAVRRPWICIVVVAAFFFSCALGKRGKKKTYADILGT